MDPISIDIVKRIQAALQPWNDSIKNKKMFGGNCFLYKGKMCIGETKHRLMVRVLTSKMKGALNTPHVSPMDFTGKPIKEFVFVSEKGFDTEMKLQKWIELGIEHATLKSNN